MASVTGYVPTEWTYDNNIYLNSDGTVKDEFMTNEFDATGGFTTIINEAKAKLATTTDATERAQLQATINAATQAKALKTLSSPKYEKYAHEVTATPGQRTAEYDLTTQQLASAERIAQTEADTEINKIKVQGNIDKGLLQLQIASGLLSEDGETYDGLGPDILTDSYIDSAVSTGSGLDHFGGSLLKKLASNFAATFPNGFIYYDDANDINKLLDALAKWSDDTQVNTGQMQHVLNTIGLGSLRASDYFKDKSTDWKDGVKRTDKRYGQEEDDDE